MSATHEFCTQNGACAIYTKLGPHCYTCGFFKPEADRRKFLPMTFCEDGMYRKIINRIDEEEHNAAEK